VAIRTLFVYVVKRLLQTKTHEERCLERRETMNDRRGEIGFAAATG
jgi:hypothetical protein